MSNVVIIPTTGAHCLKQAVESVLAQTAKTSCYVVCDGETHQQKVAELLNGFEATICYLPRNVGANGYYGHRIYAAFPHLVDEDFIFFLDQDNWFSPTHVQECVNLAEMKSLAWVYSLRNIVDREGIFVCRDNCESLGKWVGHTNETLIDTNTFCVRRETLVQICQAWHGKWGQDRLFTKAIMHYFPGFECTGRYTINYRLGGNPGSVTSAFFENGNIMMKAKYGDTFPWEQE